MLRPSRVVAPILQEHLREIMTRGLHDVGEARVGLDKSVAMVQELLADNIDNLGDTPHHWSYVAEKLRAVGLYAQDLVSVCDALADDMQDAEERIHKRRRKQTNPKRGKRTVMENALFEPEPVALSQGSCPSK